jgi:hypothetical protein
LFCYCKIATQPKDLYRFCIFSSYIIVKGVLIEDYSPLHIIAKIGGKKMVSWQNVKDFLFNKKTLIGAAVVTAVAVVYPLTVYPWPFTGSGKEEPKKEDEAKAAGAEGAAKPAAPVAAVPAEKLAAPMTEAELDIDSDMDSMIKDAHEALTGSVADKVISFEENEENKEALGKIEAELKREGAHAWTTEKGNRAISALKEAIVFYKDNHTGKYCAILVACNQYGGRDNIGGSEPVELKGLTDAEMKKLVGDKKYDELFGSTSEEVSPTTVWYLTRGAERARADRWTRIRDAGLARKIAAYDRTLDDAMVPLTDGKVYNREFDLLALRRVVAEGAKLGDKNLAAEMPTGQYAAPKPAEAAKK